MKENVVDMIVGAIKHAAEMAQEARDSTQTLKMGDLTLAWSVAQKDNIRVCDVVVESNMGRPVYHAMFEVALIGPELKKKAAEKAKEDPPLKTEQEIMDEKWPHCVGCHSHSKNFCSEGSRQRWHDKKEAEKENHH